VIGASRRPNSIGWQILHNLLQHGFKGPVYPVNPTATSIHSIAAYPSVRDIPGLVDLAIIAVPAERVLEAARECVDANVRGLVVISAGFKEIGGGGVAREQELLQLLEGTAIRMVGPNCMGVINTHDSVQLDATFAPAMPPPGPMAFMSQSGAMGLSILDYAESLGIGLSMFVSLGNKADVSGNDLLEYWRDDPNTELILMYMESFGNPVKFVELCQQITTQKPVFIVKSGHTGAGARAAASHTGALAQTALATDALITQAGAIRAEKVQDLFDLAMAFSNQPLPAGNRVAIVTNAGGPGIILADACEDNGLNVTPLSPDTEEKLRSRLPDEASVRNPVDLIASATAQSYEFAVKTVLGDPNVDAAIAAFVPPLGIQTQEVAEAIVEANALHPNKPLLTVLMGREGLPAGLAELREAKVPGYLFPESAARALGSMWRYASRGKRRKGRTVSFEVDDDTVAAIIDGTLADNRLKLSEPDVLRVLEAYGIAVVKWTFISHEGQTSLATAAAQAAKKVGRPVALKIVSPDIVHKTDVGGVVLGVESDTQIQRAVRSMVKSVSEGALAAKKKTKGKRTQGGPHSNSEPKIEGVLIQQMAQTGRETIVGVTRVPRVGPMMMFGLGGIYVEVVKDVVLRLCPLRDTDAEEMVRGVKMYRLLEGIRGEPPRDLEALKEVILRVAQLAERHPRIAELDINPLVSLDDGAIAVDARIQLESD
jgi:acetyl coenzyme A synthetase (ADP forming)-like protein